MTLIDLIFLGSGVVGLSLMCWRLWPPGGSQKLSVPHSAAPLVSVIVPARDEAAHLPQLLGSLQALDYANYEVIVVDDRSHDATAVIARSFGVQVVDGLELPSGWGGKQWACQQGANVAKGSVLLFTDADTWHSPASLSTTVAFMRDQQVAMMSALPYHAGTQWWERLTGPFHLLLLSVTGPYRRTPGIGRVFAIGQYLAFTRAAYDALGGHAAVRGSYAEDLPLAHRCLAKGLPYAVLPYPQPLYHVRMYSSLQEFMRGWRRNFRAGLRDSRKTAALEVTMMFAAFLGGGQWFSHPAAWLLSAVTITSACLLQRRYGQFSVLGPLMFPFALSLFCLATLLALSDELLGKNLVWKGRARLAGKQDA